MFTIHPTAYVPRLVPERSSQNLTIVIPLFHREKENVEEAIESSAFNNLVNIVRSLSSQDDRLLDEITKIRIGKGEQIANVNHISLDFACNLIVLDGFHGKLKDKLFEQIISKIKIPWLHFEEARQFAHNLQLKKSSEWRAYCNSGNKPENIPSKPQDIYKGSGWNSWGDWLGTGMIAHQEITISDPRDRDSKL